jgi:hypothetical protein
MLAGMKRLSSIVLVLIGGLLGAASAAAGPARNLLVELRWMDSEASSGAGAGGYVVGTAASVSPHPGGRTWSTLSGEAEADSVQRIVVLNGRSARLMLVEQQPVQWLDYAVDLPAGRPGPAAAEGARVLAAPRSELVVARSRGLVVTPQWPGGSQPVQLELTVTAADAGGAQAEIHSSVQAALGRWIAVARRGTAAPRSQPGVVSSHDAERAPQRELQLRVTLAP